MRKKYTTYTIEYCYVGTSKGGNWNHSVYNKVDLLVSKFDQMSKYKKYVEHPVLFFVSSSLDISNRHMQEWN
jgi:hypothetical protein